MTAISPVPGTTSSRRLKRLLVSFELLREFLVAGDHAHRYSILENAVPGDAILLNVQHAWPNCVELVLYSPSFDEVTDGDIIPMLPILITTPDRANA